MFDDQQETRGFQLLYDEKQPVGILQLEDLCNNNVAEIQQSLRTINLIIKNFKQDQDIKDGNQERIQSMEQESIQITIKVDCLKNIIMKLKDDIQASQAKQKISDKAFRDIQDKIIKDSQELKSQFDAQIKSKEFEYQELKDYIQRNCLQSLIYRNSFDGEKLNNDQGILFTVDENDEFSLIEAKQYETVFEKLRYENEAYRGQLIQLHKGLEEIIVICKKILDKRRSVASNQHEIILDLENSHKLLNQFNPDLFKAPLNQNCQSALNSLTENLHILKQLIQKFDIQYHFFSNSVAEDEGLKSKPCKSLEDLQKKYNYIFQQQDQMIELVENSSKQNLWKKMIPINYRQQEKQEDSIRIFIRDQQKYLNEAKLEIEQQTQQLKNEMMQREEKKKKILVQMKRQEDLQQSFQDDLQRLEGMTQEITQRFMQGK